MHSHPPHNYLCISSVNYLYIHKVCPEGVQPRNMKNRDIYWRYKKHCTWTVDASVPFKVGTLGPHTVLPVTISCPIISSWISLTVRNLFPFKDDFSFGKNQKSQGARWLEGQRYPGDLMLCQKKPLHEVWYMSRHIVMKPPITSGP